MTIILSYGAMLEFEYPNLEFKYWFHSVVKGSYTRWGMYVMMNLGAMLGTCLVWFVTLLLSFFKVVYTQSWQWWWASELASTHKPWRLYTNFHGVSKFNLIWEFNLVSKLDLLPQMPFPMLERFNKKKKKMKFISWHSNKVGFRAHITKNKLHSMSLLCRAPMNVALMLEYNHITLQFPTESGNMNVKVLWYAFFWQIPTQTQNKYHD